MSNEWTRADLPDAKEVTRAGEENRAFFYLRDAQFVLDATVAHLNAHHPKPEQTMVSARPVSPEERGELWARIRDELRGVYSSTTDQDHRKLDLAASASADTAVEYLNDRGGLGIDAREPLERALRERDEALRKKGEAFDRAVRAERERDAAVARAEQAERDRDDLEAVNEKLHREWTAEFIRANHAEAERDELRAVFTAEKDELIRLATKEN